MFNIICSPATCVIFRGSCVSSSRKLSTQTQTEEIKLERRGRLPKLRKSIPYEDLGVSIPKETQETILARYPRSTKFDKVAIAKTAVRAVIPKNGTILVQGSGKNPVAVPKKKKRDSLSILKALASTTHNVWTCMIATFPLSSVY